MIKTDIALSGKQRSLTIVALLVAASFVLICVAQVTNNFWPGPLFDYWVDVTIIEKAFDHTLTFSDLASAHNNAHRILVPRLLFIADYQWFSGTNVLLVTVSLLCKFATLALFWRLLHTLSMPVRALAIALACAAMFNVANVYNIVFNFDIQWDLVSVFACYAIYSYQHVLSSEHRMWWRSAAWLFLLLAFFSHAGALSLPVVFLLMSVAHRQGREIAINIVLTAFVLFVHSQLPFADPNNPDTGSAFAMLVLHPLVVGTFVFKALSATLAFHLGSAGLLFSTTTLLSFVTGLPTLRSKEVTHTRLFLFIAIFLFLMIVTIAAARSIFTPDVWAASRFQTTVLLFVLCIHLDALQRFSAADVLRRSAIAALVFVHGFVMFSLVQVFNYNVAFKLSNVVFFSHAYMLTHGRNQNNAPRLLLWLHGDDVIANSDNFFRQHGFGWYANKRVGTPQGRAAVDSGELLIGARSAAQSPSCDTLPALRYRETTEGGIEFATAMDDSRIVLRRQSYYAINSTGHVTGFAYPFMNEDSFLKHRELRGYSVNRDIAAFVVANDDSMPQCVYRVSSTP